MAPTTLALAILGAFTVPACQDKTQTQPQDPTVMKSMLMCHRWPSAAKITVRSNDFMEGQLIPMRMSSYGENMSPSLTWTGIPSGTVSLVVIAEDPDAHMDTPYVHWIITDLPATVATLEPMATTSSAKPSFLQGGVQGKGTSGTVGYYGMKPPTGDHAHTYHFAVLALDKTLGLSEGYDREAAVEAMKGHVLGCGELTGTFSKS